MSEIEKFDEEPGFESHRNQIVNRIVKESDRLVDELLAIIYADNEDVDARTKLQAIGMLLDRGVPKLGVDHGKADTVEDTGSRKKLRKEIEDLIQKEIRKEEK